MTPDPFDSLRSRNPAPPESLPGPPMEVARSITTGRPSLRRGLAIAGAAATLVLVAGGGWLLWSRTGGGEVAAPAATPTTGLPTGTATTSAAAEEVPELVVYFWQEAALVPVARDPNVLNVRPLPDLGSLALELLLWGPGAWDAASLPDPVGAVEAHLTSAIPAGTEVRGLTVRGGLALVDLSAEFADASPQALVQVVFTLTGPYREADAVQFLIEGVPQVVASLSSGLFTPHLAPAATTPGLESIDREWLYPYLPPLMVESPALGGMLRLPATITGFTTQPDAEVLVALVAEDGAVLWEGTAPATCPACPAGTFSLEIPPSLTAGTGWVNLTARLSTLDRALLAQHPVWLIPSLPYTDEPEIPEATTSTSTSTTTLPREETTTTLADGAAPWARAPLAAESVPAVVGETWAKAENRDRCAVLFPANPASLAADTVLHERYFGGDWGLAWDLPSGPGRWEPGGEYCADCGREAFGLGGTYFPDLASDEDSIWPNRLTWNDGSVSGYGYSHAGYGYEGLSPTGDQGQPLLAYLLIEGQGCLYNVWSYLGEEHLLALIDQLRFVEGMGAP